MARSQLLSEWLEKGDYTLDEAERGIFAVTADTFLSVLHAGFGTAGNFADVKIEIAAIRDAYASGRHKLTLAERAVLLAVGGHKIHEWDVETWIYPFVLAARSPGRSGGPATRSEEAAIFGDIRRCARAGLLDRDHQRRWFLTPSGDAALRH